MSPRAKGWSLATLAEIAQFNPKTDAPDDAMCGFVPMANLGVRYRAKLSVQAIRAWTEVRKAYTHFQDGDVLVAKVTPCFENGKAGLAQELPNRIGAGSSEFCVFRPSKGIDARYLLAWLSTEDFRRRATVAMTGSVGLKRVPKEVFLGEQVPLAPEAEQRRIADKLDTVLARVDAVNDRLARVAPLLKRFRQSVLKAATMGLWTERNGVVCDSDSGWTQTQLGEVCRKITDGEHSTPKRSASGRFLLSARNVRDGFIDLNNVDFVGDDEFVRLRQRCDPNVGDLLLSCSGSVGRVALVDRDGEYVMVRSAALIRPDPAVLDAKYLMYLLQSPTLQSQISDASRSTAQANIFLGPIKSLSVSFPSLGEQRAIVSRVELLFAYADRLEARLQAAQTAAQRLTPSLLAKAFRGELVPQDPNDEPAAELLKRLAAARDSQAAKPAKRGRSAVKT